MRSAIAAGKEITVHVNPISACGFNGAGYIIADPQTGAGAYLIEGGGRGGILIVTGIIVLAILIIGIAQLTVLGPVGLIAFAAALQLGISLIVAGLSLLFGSQLGCLAALSVAVASIINLFAFTRIAKILGNLGVPSLLSNQLIGDTVRSLGFYACQV